VVATEAEVEQADSEGQGGSADLVVTGYHTLPISDLLAIDGVVQASPVGRYPARLVLATEQADGVMLGVDRASIAAVTHFRTDYAGEPLADLFNKLAGHRTGVLLSARAAREYNLYVGQEINVEVSALGAWYTLRVPVIALLDYFPTLDPREEFFLITNLEPIFEAVGTPLPHNFWLSLAPDADRAAVRRQLRSQGVPVLQWLDTQAALHVAQTAPSRRGVLGFLSVGFAASTLLTLICAIVQSEASFRAQAAQLGSLRAMGLGRGAMGAYLIQSQGIIVFSGILGGTLIGLGMTLLFLPLLDFSGGLPPYLVRVAWDEISLIYGLLAGSLLLATLVAAVFLGRERLITVVKLGDV
jgi:putative ABC transport system permease protein